jgi:hypothetical protein
MSETYFTTCARASAARLLRTLLTRKLSPRFFYNGRNPRLNAFRSCGISQALAWFLSAKGGMPAFFIGWGRIAALMFVFVVGDLFISWAQGTPIVRVFALGVAALVWLIGCALRPPPG